MEDIFATEQIEMLQMLANDYKRSEIAKKFDISIRTVEWRFDKMRRESGFKTILGLMVYCYRNKLIK